MGFTTRQLSFQVQLGEGDFGGSGFDTVDIEPGLWASARVNKLGSPTFNSADISIAGLPLDIMNQLTRVGLQAGAVRNNLITVMAGDTDQSTQSSLVFRGVINEAWSDFSGADAIFRINAYTGTIAQMKPAKPSSFTGSTDVATILSTLAGQMGYTFENSQNVSVQLSNPYLAGSARSQALAAAEAADIYVYFEDDRGIMAICPKEKSRGTPVPVITPDTGLVGYPTCVGPGLVQVTSIYNPQLRLFGDVEVRDSIVTNANGVWRVQSLLHDLSTFPDGPWFSVLQANNIQQAGGGGVNITVRPIPSASS